MGQTIRELSTKEVKSATIFNSRFVVECCEKVHVHYRNLRILLSPTDWVQMAKGMADSLKRWEAQGSPTPKEGLHIELCRKTVATEAQDKNQIRINLNRNLYAKHEGQIFAEGANLTEPEYIHLKIRDLRIELTMDEFNALAEAVKEAKEKLDV